MANGSTTSNQFPTNLLVFKGENYERWIAQMNVIFIFQDVDEIVQQGISPLKANTSDEQNDAHKEQMKKYGKVLFLIHQCVYPNIFEKIIEEEYAKGTWEKLKKYLWWR